jgi:hypothetical protein
MVIQLYCLFPTDDELFCFVEVDASLENEHPCLPVLHLHNWVLSYDCCIYLNQRTAVSDMFNHDDFV